LSRFFLLPVDDEAKSVAASPQLLQPRVDAAATLVHFEQYMDAAVHLTHRRVCLDSLEMAILISIVNGIASEIASESGISMGNVISTTWMEIVIETTTCDRARWIVVVVVLFAKVNRIVIVIENEISAVVVVLALVVVVVVEEGAVETQVVRQQLASEVRVVDHDDDGWVVVVETAMVNVCGVVVGTKATVLVYVIVLVVVVVVLVEWVVVVVVVHGVVKPIEMEIVSSVSVWETVGVVVVVVVDDLVVCSSTVQCLERPWLARQFRGHPRCGSCVLVSRVVMMTIPFEQCRAIQHLFAHEFASGHTISTLEVQTRHGPGRWMATAS